eukprot:m.133127 g.133127  ORF g.133127 m.133127 type:complete len:376 (-) comp13821_c0_seq1:21-1148(-)
MAATSRTDFFISHTQRNGLATTLATDLHSTLTSQGYSVWFDVKMPDRSTRAMEAGVRGSRCLIAVITGPCSPADPSISEPPEKNAYFARDFCVAELRWAVEAGVRIQPVILAADKGRIAALMEYAPTDLKDLVNKDFITLDRSDIDYWNVGIQKVIKAAGFDGAMRTPSTGSAQAYAQPPPVPPCVFCSTPGINACGNCGQRICPQHLNPYTTGGVGTISTSHLCDTCRDLHRIMDKHLPIPNADNTMRSYATSAEIATYLLISLPIVTMPCGIAYLSSVKKATIAERAAETRAAFLEYNARVSPPTPVRVPRFIETKVTHHPCLDPIKVDLEFFIYPHSHPSYGAAFGGVIGNSTSETAPKENSHPLLVPLIPN